MAAQSTTTDKPKPIGEELVNALYQQYLGRPAYPHELIIYKNHLDDKVLRADLGSAKEAAIAKQEEARNQFANLMTTAPTADYNYDGNYPLVKFQNDPNPTDDNDVNTIYLFDKQNKTYIPFVSMEALTNFYGKPKEEVLSRLQILPSTALQNPDWQGTFIKRADGGIQDNGSFKPNFNYYQSSGQSNASLESIYGQNKVDPQVEEQVANFIGLAMTTVKRQGAISDATFQKTVGDADQLAKYTNALLYGGYDLDAIYRDIKAKELYGAGNQNYANFKAFDENIPASSWYASNDGKTAKQDATLTPPTQLLGLDSSLFNNPIFDIPGTAFSTLVPPVDITSASFQEEADQIQASWYDLMMQRADAQTEQQKAIADSNWKIFKDSLAKKYNIQLSNNARTAWGQLQDLFANTFNRGVGNSGIMNEAMDRYLSDIRRTNQLLRESQTDEKDLEQRNYLLTSGTPDEISAFVNANPAKAEEWGLIPSSDVKTWFSRENLKKLYPNLSDQEINQMAGMVLDENGFYRSQLYQNLYANKYDLGEQKRSYQEGKLYQQKLNEEQKAYAPYTSDNPFLQYDTPSTTDNVQTTYNNVPSAPQTSNTNQPAPKQTPPPANIDQAWESFKTKNTNVDWSRYSPVTGGQEKNYVNIQNPGGSTLYGIKRDLAKEQEAMKTPGLYKGDWDAFHKEVYKY